MVELINSNRSATRCLFPSTDSPIYFSDVVFADVFTSFAKVFGDVWLSMCMLLPGGSLLSLPSLDGPSQWILPSMMRYVSLTIKVLCVLTGC